MKLDDDIHNYNEHLVLERIIELKLEEKYSADFISDVCCIALNQLSPRYIRYEVDMSFYLPQQERMTMEMNAREAIDKAIRFLNERVDSDNDR